LRSIGSSRRAHANTEESIALEWPRFSWLALTADSYGNELRKFGYSITTFDDDTNRVRQDQSRYATYRVTIDSPLIICRWVSFELSPLLVPPQVPARNERSTVRKREVDIEAILRAQQVLTGLDTI
jgi:hypothetical protein